MTLSTPQNEVFTTKNEVLKIFISIYSYLVVFFQQSIVKSLGRLLRGSKRHVAQMNATSDVSQNTQRLHFSSARGHSRQDTTTSWPLLSALHRTPNIGISDLK